MTALPCFYHRRMELYDLQGGPRPDDESSRVAVIVVTLDLRQEGGSSGGATATVLAIVSSRGGHFGEVR